MNDQLIDLAHPRDRGRGALDKTAFLQSQKDWNLERDDGWNGVEVLFAFDKVQFNNNTPNPTYEVPWLYEDGCVVLDLDNWPLNAFESIPLTLSSNVEGGLMEAIIRYDDRIQMEDLWARLSVLLSLASLWRTLINRRPGICGHGGIYVPHTLTQRRSRFRERNWITCWGAPRKGSENLQKHIRNQMSPAMIAANSTRGLHKPSRAEQREMKKVNAGKHNQNAGGYALERDGSEEGAPARKRSRAHQVRKGASTRRSPRQPTPSVVSAPEASTEADWNPLLDQNPLLDPRLLMDHDGFELDNQYAAPAVGNGMPDQNIFCSTNPPVEAPYTFYGSSPSLGSNTYQCAPNFGSNTYQFAPSFVRSTSMWDTASMLGEQQLNPFQDLVHDW